MVTAETATALPALVLVLGFALTVQSVVATRAVCADSARAGARAAARGDTDAVVAETVRRVGSPASGVSVARRAGLVTVTVSVRPRGLVSLLRLPEVRAEAVAADEAGGAGSAPPIDEGRR